jgi:hypothetical protein
MGHSLVYGRQEYPSKVQAAWARQFHDQREPYKPEHDWFPYDLGDGIWYRPDFWMAQSKHWVEVKAGMDQVTTDVQRKAQRLADKSGHDVQLVVGWPDSHETRWFRARSEGLNRSVFIGTISRGVKPYGNPAGAAVATVLVLSLVLANGGFALTTYPTDDAGGAESADGSDSQQRTDVLPRIVRPATSESDIVARVTLLSAVRNDNGVTLVQTDAAVILVTLAVLSSI